MNKEIDAIEYICIFGGYPINVRFHFSCSQQRIKSKLNGSFFVDNTTGTFAVEPLVEVNFSLLKGKGNNHKVKKKIIINRKINFVETDAGNLVLSCLTDNEKDVLWNLSLDRNFSCFKYFVSHEAVGASDFFQLIFNRFLLQHTFINHHGLIIHAAGGSINGKGMVFPAVSGTGKSTLSHLLLPFSENQLFSEERIIMRRLDDGWHLWGTPWKGTGSIARNESVPLSALVFLSQALETKITPLSTSAALRRLLETVSIPWYSQEWADKGLAVCESLLRDIPAFELAFRPDETAVQAVADFAVSFP